MPITGIGSFPPTMQEFINHWTQVNATLGATPLTLRGGWSLLQVVASPQSDRRVCRASLIVLVFIPDRYFCNWV
jgi:hypothetical protein